MEIKNCKKCGKVFNSIGEKICADCIKEEEELFKGVKDYLYDHPNTSIQEVSEATGVEEATILRYLRDGKLEISNSSATYLNCEKCGKSIKSGRYCDNCQKSLANSFSQISGPTEEDLEKKKKEDAIKKLKELSNAKMHTGDLNKDR